MEGVQKNLPELASLRGVAVTATIYALLHLLLVAALITFGQRAGGYPLDPLAILVYGLLAIVGTLWALRRTIQGRDQTAPGRLLPLLALAIFLAVSLAGVFFATERFPGEPLARFGLQTTYPPYLDDDGQFAWVNLAMAFGVVLLALAARWRDLLVAGLTAQGLALLLSPSLLLAGLLHLPESWVYGLYPRGEVLIALPVLYAAGAFALGWRPPLRRRLPLLLVAIGVLVAALLTLGNLASAALWAVVPALLFLVWRLRAWSRSGEPPSRMAALGANLALLALVAMLSWRYLGPEGALGDGYLPPEGKTMGWIGKTVPADAYGPAGDVLLGLKLVYPWLLGAAGLIWLAAVGRIGRGLGIRGVARRLGFGGGLVALGLALVYQGPLALFIAGPGPVWLPTRGMAGVLPMALGERGQWPLVDLGYPLLGMALVGLAVVLPRSTSQRRAWLTFAATILGLVAAAILSIGLIAGTALALRSQGQLSLPEYRLAAQIQLALGLPLNVGFALTGWLVVAGGIRALWTPGAVALSTSACLRGSALAVGALVVASVAFWHLTALPVAETSPADGATNVPTNAPIVVRLEPGSRNWGPSIRAVYADSGTYVRGTTGGFGLDTVAFTPEGGWRPKAAVEVEVCCGPNTRSYRFSFTTAAGPSPEVTPLAGPGPKPTPVRPAGPEPAAALAPLPIASPERAAGPTTIPAPMPPPAAQGASRAITDLPAPVVSLATDPRHGSVVYALLVTNALYRSQDDGHTWQRLPFPAAPRPYPGPYDSQSSTQVFIVPQQSIQIPPGNPDRIFVVSGRDAQSADESSRSLYRSDDGGKSWRAVLAGPYAWSVADEKGEILYVWRPGAPSPYESGKLYRTADGGQTWQEVYTGCFPPAAPGQVCPGNHQGITTLLAGPGDPDLLYAGTDFGVYRSFDGGRTWAQFNQEMPPTDRAYRWTPVMMVAATDGTIFALTEVSANREGFYGLELVRLRAGASAWETGGNDVLRQVMKPYQGQDGFETLAADTTIAGRLYGGTRRGLFVSDDGGENWRTVDLPGVQKVYRIATGKSGTATSSDKVYLWTDAGLVTWRKKD